MTPEALQAALDANDAEGCIALLATATEAERRAAAKEAAARLRAITADVPARFTNLLRDMPDEDLGRLFPGAPARRGGLRAAQIATLATATLGELKKLGERCLPPVDDAVAVLSARRPPWVDDWAEEILSWGGAGQRPLGMDEHWRFVRRLVREGLCARPRGSRYIHGMIGAISAFRHGGSIREALLDDPGLLDDEVWEVFETEPMPGLLGLIPVDPLIPPEFRWEHALAGFADEGRLSRARLLDASLGGLECDFHEARARWFALMHETLRPTLDERAERSGRYLGLAASRNPSTVAFSLKALTALDGAGRLEPGPVVAAIGPALLARAKGTVRSALDLIDRAARRDPGLRARAASVAVDATAHESPEVHEAVLDLIERHGDRADRALADLLRDRVGVVAASQRARLAAWLGPGPAPEGPAAADAKFEDLIARASALDPGVAERAGVTAALAVLKQGGEVPAVDFEEAEVPRLDPARAIAPVGDLDELIGLFSAVLEDPGDPDDLERVLDGVSRLGDRRPDDFASRTGPLQRRAEESTPMWTTGASSLRDLALGWITGRPQAPRDGDLGGYLVGVLARRILAISLRAAERQAAPLLSAPTHSGGWIDPRVLVERVKTWAASSSRLDRLDGSLALLRLAPDPVPRAEALRAATGLEGHYASALRHALGGSGESVGPDARIWVAAARARSPREDDPHVEARHPGLGPDAGRAARYAPRPGPHPTHENWYARRNNPLIVREPASPPDPPHDLPTVLIHDMRAHAATHAARWVATIWPLGRDSFFAAGADWLLGFEHSPTEARSYRPFLEALLDPDVPLRPTARLLLAGTLSANAPELQGLAVDALIAAVDDGRLDGRLLGEALHSLLTDGLAKPARLAKALGDASRASPLHALVVARAIQLALVGLSPPPRDLRLLLELLKELLVEAGEGLSVAGIEDYLREMKVAGKTAKLAGDLLSLARRPDSSSRVAAAVRALEGRTARAERWTRLGYRASVR